MYIYFFIEISVYNTNDCIEKNKKKYFKHYFLLILAHKRFFQITKLFKAYF